MEKNRNDTSRISKYSKLREEIQGMHDTSAVDLNKENFRHGRTKTIPININDKIDTVPLETHNQRTTGSNNVKISPLFKKYQRNNLIKNILYGVAGLTIIVLVIIVIVLMAKGR